VKLFLRGPQGGLRPPWDQPNQGPYGIRIANSTAEQNGLEAAA